MVLDLRGKKVVVIGGKQSVGRAIAEAVAHEGADVMIWLRKCIKARLRKATAAAITQPQVSRQVIIPQTCD
jgi:NAD(P)-dependent dehydrogenase (short-subunit alcohol dehydrogenase family)